MQLYKAAGFGLLDYSEFIGQCLGKKITCWPPQHGQGQSWEIPSKKISFAENWAVALEKIIGGDLFLTTRVIGEVGWQGRIRRRRMIKGKMPQESLGEFACSCLADKEALGRS